MSRVYVVFRGRVPGVYAHWEQCQKQVTGFKGNSYKSYSTKAEAQARWMDHLVEEKDQRKSNRMKTFAVLLAAVTAVLIYFCW